VIGGPKLYRICIVILILLTGCANVGSQIERQAKDEETNEVVREKALLKNNEVDRKNENSNRPDMEHTEPK
jgi:type III secretory pathway lipoprotein EscJ